MEEWKTFGTIEISDHGNVRCDGQDLPVRTVGGYDVVDLYGRAVRLDRLIAFAFIRNPEGCDSIRHRNGSRRDNSLWNLEWTQ